MIITANLAEHDLERAMVKMRLQNVFLGAVLLNSGDIVIELVSETAKNKASHLAIFTHDGKCVHRCASSVACWHVAAGAIFYQGVYGGDKILEWERDNTWPSHVPMGGKDLTPSLLKRAGNFRKLTPTSVWSGPFWPSLDQAPLELTPEPVIEPVVESAPTGSEDAWVERLSLPRELLKRTMEFRTEQRQRLFRSPELWSRVPNLGGEDPGETCFAEWLSSDQLSSVRKVNYIPQDGEMMDALAPLLYDTWSPSLLIGPKSSGKTTLAYYLARILCLPVTAISGSTDTNEDRLIGYHDLIADQGVARTRFVPGVLLDAVTKGEALVFNELNQALPDVISVMNDLLDWQKVVHVKGVGEVKPAPGFRLVATMNPGYVGTAPLNQALEDRFRRVDVPYPPKEVVAELLPSYQTELSELYSRIVKRVESGELDEEVISIRTLIRCAEELTLLGSSLPLTIISNICSGMQDRNARQIIEDIVKSMFP